MMANFQPAQAARVHRGRGQQFVVHLFPSACRLPGTARHLQSRAICGRSILQRLAVGPGAVLAADAPQNKSSPPTTPSGEDTSAAPISACSAYTDDPLRILDRPPQWVRRRRERELGDAAHPRKPRWRDRNAGNDGAGAKTLGSATKRINAYGSRALTEQSWSVRRRTGSNAAVCFCATQHCAPCRNVMAARYLFACDC